MVRMVWAQKVKNFRNMNMLFEISREIMNNVNLGVDHSRPNAATTTSLRGPLAGTLDLRSSEGK